MTGRNPASPCTHTSLGFFNALLILWLMLGAGMGTAQFSLIRENPGGTSSGWTFEIVYTPPKEPVSIDCGGAPLSLGPDDDDLVPYLLPREEPPRIGRRGILLAVPPGVSNEAADWSVSATGAGTDLSRLFHLESAQIGSIPGIQLWVDLESLEGLIDPVTIILAGPGSDATVLPRQDTRIETLAQSQQALASLFLNGASIRAMPKSSRRPRGTSYPPPVPGEYRVTYSRGDEIILLDLSAVGAIPADVSGLALDHHGTLIPPGGVIGNSLWFYAPRRVTLSDRTDSVFVTRSAAVPSGTMATRLSHPTLASQLSAEIPRITTRLYAPNARYERSSPKPLGDRFVAHQVRRPAGSGFLTSANLSLAVHDVLTSTTVGVEVVLLSINETQTENPDHFADFTLEGEPIPTTSWEGITSHTLSGSVDLTLPNSAVLTLVHSIPLVIPSAADRQNLDRVTLTWEGKPRVDASHRARFDLRADTAPRLATIGGLPPGTLSSDILLLDITDSAVPVRIVDPPVFPDDDGGVAVEFEAPATACSFHLELFSNLTAPSVVRPAEALPATAAGVLERIYVRDPVLAADLAPLVALRGAAGTVELDPQAAYNTFNGGQEDPGAIRLAIIEIIASASSTLPVPTLLLVGHGTFDRRDYLGFVSGAQIPVYIQETIPTGGVTIEAPVDYPYGLLFGDDSLPDVRLGRIPVRTGAELAVVVNRIVQQDALKETLRSQQRPGLFVTDNDTAFLFDAATWPDLWDDTGHPGIQYDLPFPTPPATSLNSTEIQTIEDDIQGYIEGSGGGLAFLLYTGHGNIDRWAAENILNNTSVAGYQTQNKWPIVATFTCLNGYYAFPGVYTCLAEAWLNEPGNGAVANIAPTAVEFYTEQKLFAEELLARIALPPASRPRDVGGVLHGGQITYVTKYPLLDDSVQLFVLFGDPETDFTYPSSGGSSVGEWESLGGVPHAPR